MPRLEVRGEAALMEDLASLLAASDDSIESVSNFVIRSTSTRAKNAIRSGGKSGRIYERPDPARTVQASAPGEAPANDLGWLADSITFRLFSTSGMVGVVYAEADYAADLELGNTSIQPRPFLFPAFREAIAEASGRLRRDFEARL